MGTVTPPSPAPSGDRRLDFDKFVVSKRKPGRVQTYHLCEDNGVPLAFVARPVLKLRGDIEVFDDETKLVKRLALRRGKAPGLNERFTLLDSAERVICTYERHAVRSAWRILDPFDQEIARARGPSWVRTLLQYVVIWGMFMSIRFDICLADGSSVGSFTRKSRVSDRYELDLTSDPGRRLDRRIAVGLAILVDAVDCG